MTEIVPRRMSQIERQSIAVAVQTGREMVLDQALDRLRVGAIHERIENAHELARHAAYRLSEFDELAERVCQLRPRLEGFMYELEEGLALSYAGRIRGYMNP